MTDHVVAPRLREPAHRVHPRARLMWTLSSAAAGVVVVVVPAVALVVLGRFTQWWWALALLAMLVIAETLITPRWRYAVHRWEVTDTAVYTQVGWWVRERRIAPMSRIQTVDYREGAVARLFGLASVTVTTASAAGALSIDGLDRATAQALTDELTARADAVPGDAT